jgi:uncharacterized phiE125 gp8 family phage protein
MWYPVTVSDPPSTEPVSLIEAKQQCGIVDTNSDALLKRLISSERAFVEKYCGIKIMEQEVTAKCDSFSNFERVPVAPVQNVSSVTYTAPTGAALVLDPAVYEVRSDGLDTAIVLNSGRSWPPVQKGSRIAVVLNAGFEECPPDLCSAILLRVSSGFYLSRKDPTLRLESIDGVIRRDWDNTGAMDGTFRRAVSDLLENYRCWMAL